MTDKTFSEDRGVYADILMDNWFKRAFKEYGNARRLMLLFLQTLIPERNITSIEYAPEESTNQNPDGKSIRVDVECCDSDGQRFIVEVQQSAQHHFADRAIFNSTFAIQRQIREGGDSYRFLPVYFIGILRFNMHPDPDRFLFRYSLKEDWSGEILTDDLHYIFLEVRKCNLHPGVSIIEKFGYALDKMPSLEKRPDGFEGEIFDLLFSSANLSNFAPEDKIKYHNDMTTERDIRNQIVYAHDKGIEQGIKIGIEQEVEKRSAQRNEIARAMLADGMDKGLVAKYSGLTDAEIEVLKSNTTTA